MLGDRGAGSRSCAAGGHGLCVLAFATYKINFMMAWVSLKQLKSMVLWCVHQDTRGSDQVGLCV